METRTNQKTPKRSVLLRVPETVHAWVMSRASVNGQTATGAYNDILREVMRKESRAK